MKISIIKGPRFEQQKALAQRIILKEVRKNFQHETKKEA